jgi:hypothetical protein
MLKPNTFADIRRQIIAIERRAEELAKVSPPDKALRLRQAIDLLTEARAVELYRLR